MSTTIEKADAKIPEREAWLWQNLEARESFETGVKEAKARLGTAMDFSAFYEDADQELEQ